MKRLKIFAHSRCDKPRLVLNHKLSKAAYVKKSDIKPDNEKKLFNVPSEKTVSAFYVVDPKDGSCTCPSGLFGGFCKHQAAMFLHYEEYSPSIPGITAEARYAMAVLAFGKNAKSPEFYQSLSIFAETVTSNSNSNF